MATSTEIDNIRLNQIVDNGVNIYGSREKIRANLVSLAKNYLKILDGDISRTSYLAYLIDTLSILTSNQIYYQTKIYNEFFLVSAQLNESVQNLAKWIGYKIPKAKCAEVDITFTLPLDFTLQTVNFNFPKYFKCSAGDIDFTIKSNSDVIDGTNKDSFTAKFDIEALNKADVSGGKIINNTILSVKDSSGYNVKVFVDEEKKNCLFNLPFTQCKYEIQTFTIPESLLQNQFYSKQLEFTGQVADLQVFVCSPSTGQTLMMTTYDHEAASKVETFNPNTTFLDSAGQICKFTEWNEAINGIYTINSTEKQFSWVGYYNRGIIGFGNGILGKQPAPGSMVIVVLKLTEGADGNVISFSINNADTLTTLTAYNEVANINFDCTNAAAAHGGLDILSTSELKNKAIVNLSTKNRLVTDYDYDNAITVMDNTTLTECVPILKRSDIKINEITLYFLCEYTFQGLDEIVPMRSCELDLIDPSFDSDGKLTVKKQYEISVGKDQIPFITLFNIELDKYTRIATYKYTATHVTGVNTQLYSNSVFDTLQGSCYIDALTSTFDIDFTNTNIISTIHPLKITFNVNHIPNKIDRDKNTLDYKWTIDDFWMDGINTTNEYEITHFKAYCITKWGNFTTYTDTENNYFADIQQKDTEEGSRNFSEKQYKSFSWKLDSYDIVPDGKQRFEFQILCYCPKTDPSGNYYIKSRAHGNVFVGLRADRRKRLLNPISGEEADGLDYIVFEWKLLKTYYSDVIITQDLSDCMQSNVTVDYKLKGNPSPDSKLVYHIHDVPAIYKDYFDKVMSVETSNFELNVLQKLLENSNFAEKRMMTDFTNIKFADTYGPMTNLKYNKPDYIVESRFVHTPWWHKQQDVLGNDMSYPDGIIENKFYKEPDPHSSNIYYVINGKMDDNDEPVANYMGKIACKYTTFSDDGSYDIVSYAIIDPYVGMIIKVKDELDNFGSIQTCYWTGSEWKRVEDYSIPLNIHLKVHVNEKKISKSDSAISESVIQAMSKYFNGRMGLQKNLDRSEIIKVCRSVEGVEYVELLEPEFDIKFNYEINDLTQEELLNFTPQYVGFRMLTDTNTDYTNTTIDVQVVRD